MKANEIYRILNRLEKVSYDCILIDGRWGIGKTYEIEEYARNNKKVCKISLFGIKNTDQIYHELLIKTMNKDGVLGNISSSAIKVANKISGLSNKTEEIKEIVDRFLTERECYFLLTKEFENYHIVVFDDLERLSDNINFQEVLGIIEEVKQCNYVKVVIVANVSEIIEDRKNLLEKYTEKVIDRTYHITECSSEIKWLNLNVDASFIKGFLNDHNVVNLRTIIKAQNFYDDIRNECDNITDESFLEKVRLICYSVVVEDIEKLYYIDPKETNKSADVISLHLQNDFENRIRRYIPYIKSNDSLLHLIYQYYQNENNQISNQIYEEYKAFIESGKKPIFYKNDTEVLYDLECMKKEIESIENPIGLSRLIDKYVYWSRIIGNNSDDILERFRTKFKEILTIQVKEEIEDLLSYSSTLLDFSEKEVQEIYNICISEAREYRVGLYIDYLKKITNNELAYDYSYDLRKCYESTYYRSIIDDRIEELLIRSSFPIDNVNDYKYRVSYNILFVLEKHDNSKLMEFCDRITTECDHMAGNRIRVVIENIIRGY